MTPDIHRLSPGRAVPGGRLTIDGHGFPVSLGHVPVVTIGGTPARIVRASPTSVTVRLPEDAPGGLQPIALEGVQGATPFVEVGTVVTTGVHQVDSPVFDADGRLYATLSGGRGQETPVSVFRIDRDGSREAFVDGLANATGLAIDGKGVLHVSSRFEGKVYAVASDGTFASRAENLGVACGLAFGSDGTLYVGDRSGTIHRVRADEDTPEAFATLPGSIAAFHLAMSPEGVLYVTAPTLNSSDAVYRIGPDGSVERWAEGFGRPQGLAFDPSGHLHVVDALAGDSGLYRLGPDGTRDLLVSGEGLIGVAFAPAGGFVVCSSETIYRFS